MSDRLPHIVTVDHKFIQEACDWMDATLIQYHPSYTTATCKEFVECHAVFYKGVTFMNEWEIHCLSPDVALYIKLTWG